MHDLRDWERRLRATVLFLGPRLFPSAGHIHPEIIFFPRQASLRLCLFHRNTPQALRIASEVPGTKSVRPTLERLYRNTCISSRYFAVPDFTPKKQLKGDPTLFPADRSFEVSPVGVCLSYCG